MKWLTPRGAMGGQVESAARYTLRLRLRNNTIDGPLWLRGIRPARHPDDDPDIVGRCGASRPSDRPDRVYSGSAIAVFRAM